MRSTTFFNAKLTDMKSNGVKKPKIPVLKRASNYFSVQYEWNEIHIEFVDILNYLSPCALSDFLEMPCSCSLQQVPTLLRDFKVKMSGN